MSDIKKRLRSEMRRKVQALSAGARQAAGAEICSHILAMDAVQRAVAIAMYAAMPSEPDLNLAARMLLERPCTVAFPRYNNALNGYEMVPIQSLNNDFIVGAYGVSEPRPGLPEMDMDAARKLAWLVPGLAFDRGGNRLGRGGGHYDRLLEETTDVRIGVAFDTQLVDSVPVVGHDIPMDFVVTESGVTVCSKITPIKYEKEYGI